VQLPNDIPIQSATILNNQVSLVDISGFNFNTAEVVTINCEYIIKRTTTSPANNLVENGFIKGNFDGAIWTITREQIGDAGITELSINGAGQIQYTSSLITGTNYSGQISFKAKVFNEA
jgi:hypothetical protein